MTACRAVCASAAGLTGVGVGSGSGAVSGAGSCSGPAAVDGCSGCRAIDGEREESGSGGDKRKHHGRNRDHGGLPDGFPRRIRLGAGCCVGCACRFLAIGRGLFAGCASAGWAKPCMFGKLRSTMLAVHRCLLCSCSYACSRCPILKTMAIRSGRLPCL